MDKVQITTKKSSKSILSKRGILISCLIVIVLVFIPSKKNDSVKSAAKHIQKGTESNFKSMPIKINNTDSLQKNLHPQTNDSRKQYGAILQDGKMMAVQNGYLMQLKSISIMNDRTQITPEGILIKPNGAKIKMQEGDYLDISGELILNQNNTRK